MTHFWQYNVPLVEGVSVANPVALISHLVDEQVAAQTNETGRNTVMH